MEELPRLIHLNRLPLPLERIPDHLRIEIISKQSAATIFNLPYTNSKACILVETVLSQNLHVATIREIFTKYDRKELYDPVTDEFDAEVELSDIEMAMPISYYLGSLNSWLATVSTSIQCFLLKKNSEISREILRKMEPLTYVNTYHISELWQEEQRRGPPKLRLQGLQNGLWRKILSKSPAVSASRLARTQMAVSYALDCYIESVQSIRIMDDYSHWLPCRVDNCPDWSLRNEFRSGYLLPLFSISIYSNLWLPCLRRPPSKDRKHIEELEEQLRNRDLSEKRQRRVQLGQVEMQLSYTLDRAAYRFSSAGPGIPLLNPEEDCKEFMEALVIVKNLILQTAEGERKTSSPSEMEAKIAARIRSLSFWGYHKRELRCILIVLKRAMSPFFTRWERQISFIRDVIMVGLVAYLLLFVIGIISEISISTPRRVPYYHHV